MARKGKAKRKRSMKRRKQEAKSQRRRRRRRRRRREEEYMGVEAYVEVEGGREQRGPSQAAPVL